MSELTCPTPDEMSKLKTKYSIMKFMRYALLFMTIGVFEGIRYFKDCFGFPRSVFNPIEISVSFFWFYHICSAYTCNPFKLLDRFDVIRVRDNYLRTPEVVQYIKMVNSYGRPLYAMDVEKFKSFSDKAYQKELDERFVQAEKEIYSLT